jgi:hypothetical protein
MDSKWLFGVSFGRARARLIAVTPTNAIGVDLRLVKSSNHAMFKKPSVILCGSIMVWGCMMANGSSCMIKIDGDLDAELVQKDRWMRIPPNDRVVWP